MGISDGVDTRLGSLTSDPDRFAQWKTIDGRPVTAATSSLEVLIRGVFDKQRLLELIRHFIVFEVEPARITKKIAQYHEFHATARAIDTTIRASRPGGDRRCGVIWHTQRSGKSLTMLCYAGKLIAAPEMANPTLVLLTDRTTWTTSSLARSPGASRSCGKIRCRPRAASTCASC